MAYISKFGDWTKAGVVLRGLKVSLCPAFKAQITEDGQMVLDKVLNHIKSQDLSWTPLAPQTVLRKGSSKIYVETGYLSNHLEVRKVRAPKDGITIFIGASAWKRTPEGVKLSDLMIWLEYGTNNGIPARPLVRPTFQEVKPIIESNWRSLLGDMIQKGGK